MIFDVLLISIFNQVKLVPAFRHTRYLRFFHQIARMEEKPEASSVDNKLKRSFEEGKNTSTSKSKKFKAEKDLLEETNYYFENGLRKVYPYMFTYSSYCKGRWVGRKLLEVLKSEFRGLTEEQHDEVFSLGNVSVNGKKIGVNYVLRDNDLIENVIHRHEFPIIAAPLKIVHLSEDMVVIDKPPSIPVHPCGRYRHNSVVFILQKENKIPDPYVLHRLDRHTSGLLMFARNPDVARKMTDAIKERGVQKQYVCRVEGNFPEESITCDRPVELISPKLGICMATTEGRECVTEFKKMSFNGKSSVVLCKPKTGRMHQIRVHLQYLGFPILNDVIYNSYDFGPEKGKNANYNKSLDELLELLLVSHSKKNFVKTSENDKPSTSDINLECQKALENYTNKDPDFQKYMSKNSKNPDSLSKHSWCFECKQEYVMPQPKDSMIFLHALTYKGPDWEYSTDMPIWATEDWPVVEQK